VTFGLAVVGAGNYFGLDGALGSSFPKGFRDWFMSGEPRTEMPATA
jgi:hypothetical protein